MRWFAVHHELAIHPKWMTLPMDLRGAWITMMTLAAASPNRGCFRDRATAEALVGRELSPHVYSKEAERREAADLISQLIDRGWIDEAEDGTLMMHDFDEWQAYSRKPSESPEAWRDRKRKQREKREQDTTDTGRDRTVPRDPAMSRGTEEPTSLEVHRLGNLYEAFTQLTGLPCTKADEGKIDNLCRNFDKDEVRRAMYAEAAANPNYSPEKFIGRTFHRLREGEVAA